MGLETRDSINVSHKMSSQQSYLSETTTSESPERSIGWALNKPRSGSVRFSENVRHYLTAKFDIGETTGMKVNPNDVEAEMRISKDENNQRRFARSEWLTSSQIKSFFSRLSSTRRKQGSKTTASRNKSDELDIVDEINTEEMIEQVGMVVDQIGVKYPIIHDIYNLCKYYKEGKLHVIPLTFHSSLRIVKLHLS